MKYRFKRKVVDGTLCKVNSFLCTEDDEHRTGGAAEAYLTYYNIERHRTKAEVRVSLKVL